MTLTEFLLARIAEDEDVAQMASPGPWKVRYSPARVLAECEAKREIVMCAQSPVIWGDSAGALAHCCQSLAAVYADHPDYLPEWKI